jgi:hypothetical protein
MRLAPELYSELVDLLIFGRVVVSLGVKFLNQSSQLLLFVVNVDAVGAEVVMLLFLKHSIKFNV